MKCYMRECIHHLNFSEECDCENEVYIDYCYGSSSLPSCMKFQAKGEPSQEEIVYGTKSVDLPKRYE